MGITETKNVDREAILTALQEVPTRSYDNIGKQFGVTHQTIRYYWDKYLQEKLGKRPRASRLNLKGSGDTPHQSTSPEFPPLEGAVTHDSAPMGEVSLLPSLTGTVEESYSDSNTSVSISNTDVISPEVSTISTTPVVTELTQPTEPPQETTKESGIPDTVYKTILEGCATIETQLKTQFQATGRGIVEKMQSVAHKLSYEMRVKISAVAMVRNKLVHANEFDETKLDEYVKNCEVIKSTLNNLYEKLQGKKKEVKEFRSFNDLGKAFGIETPTKEVKVQPPVQREVEVPTTYEDNTVYRWLGVIWTTKESSTPAYFIVKLLGDDTTDPLAARMWEALAGQVTHRALRTVEAKNYADAVVAMSGGKK